MNQPSLPVGFDVNKRGVFSLRSPALLIGLITFVGLVIRLWKIDFGLPEVPFTNEEITSYRALNLASGDFNPHNFVHPHLYYYLSFFLDALYILGGLATRRFHNLSEAWTLYKTDPTVFYVIGRSLSALFGTLTIPLTYWVGKKAFNEKVGILGSLFLAFSLLHVQWSQIAYMDVPLTFFVVLSFLFGFLAFEKGRLWDFILCGLCGGLSASTKYQGSVTLIWGPLACFLYALRNQQNPFQALGSTKNLLFLLSFLIGFTLGTPFWILSFPEFLNHFLLNWGWIKPYGQGHTGMEGNWNWFYYLQPLTSYSVGFSVLACGIIGALFLARRTNACNLFFLSFPGLYFLIAGAAKLRQVKYLMPILPFICISAAFFLVEWVERGTAKRGSQRVLAALFWAGFLAVLPTAISTLRYNYLKMFPDTRKLASAWVDTYVSPESSVLITSLTFYRPPAATGPQTVDLDPTLMDQRANNRSSLKSLDEYREEGFDYVVLDEWHLQLLLVEEVNNPKYQEAIKRYQKFLDDLKKSATLVAEFSPYRGEKAEYDRENVFLASRSLWKLKSLGPLVQIYKL